MVLPAFNSDPSCPLNSNLQLGADSLSQSSNEAASSTTAVLCSQSGLLPSEDKPVKHRLSRHSLTEMSPTSAKATQNGSSLCQALQTVSLSTSNRQPASISANEHPSLCHSTQQYYHREDSSYTRQGRQKVRTTGIALGNEARYNLCHPQQQ